MRTECRKISSGSKSGSVLPRPYPPPKSTPILSRGQTNVLTAAESVVCLRVPASAPADRLISAAHRSTAKFTFQLFILFIVYCGFTYYSVYSLHQFARNHENKQTACLILRHPEDSSENHHF